MALAPSPTLTALTIAGSDPSGGAGVQADLRAFEALGVHGASVLTVVTAQGTRGVRKVDPLRPPMVRAQLDAVFEDLAPRAAKTGALGNAAVVEIVADALRTAALPHVVVDPVINPTYQELARHYGVAILPARVRKPRLNLNNSQYQTWSQLKHQAGLLPTHLMASV